MPTNLHGCSHSCQQCSRKFLSNGGFRVRRDIQNDAVSIHSKENFFRGFQKRCPSGSYRRRRTRRPRSLYSSHQTWYSPNPNSLFVSIENINVRLVSLFSFFFGDIEENVGYPGDSMNIISYRSKSFCHVCLLRKKSEIFILTLRLAILVPSVMKLFLNNI